MKKNILVLIIFILLIGVFVTTYNIRPVSADSGFDASFDSSDYSSDSEGGDLFYLIYLCFEYPPLTIAIIIILLIIYYRNNKKKKTIIERALNDKLELLNVSKYPDDKKVEIEAFNLYKKIQYAWMNFDEDMIRSCTTDEMYNMYLMQLDTLKMKNQKNLMYDIKYISSNILKEEIINGQKTITMNMKISCYDFIIDTKTNKVVRGNALKLNTYLYELTFVKTVDNKGYNICPRCGAPVEGNNSGVCDYCKSTLVNNNYTLIMSKKEMISKK